MSLQIYQSEDKTKITVCDADGKCEVFCKVDEVIFEVKRQKGQWLSDEDKKEIARLYREGMDATEIGRDYGITKQAVYKVVKRADTLPLEIVEQIVELSQRPFLTSGDISTHTGVHLDLVNEIIIRHRSNLERLE